MASSYLDSLPSWFSASRARAFEHLTAAFSAGVLVSFLVLELWPGGGLGFPAPFLFLLGVSLVGLLGSRSLFRLVRCAGARCDVTSSGFLQDVSAVCFFVALALVVTVPVGFAIFLFPALIGAGLVFLLIQGLVVRRALS